MTKVSRYHEEAGFDYTTKTRLVTSIISYLYRKVDRDSGVQYVRAGVPAGVVNRMLRLDLTTSSMETVGRCSIVVLAYLFACRSVTASYMRPDDMVPSMDRGISVRVVHWMAKQTARPLVSSFPTNTS